MYAVGQKSFREAIWRALRTECGRRRSLKEGKVIVINSGNEQKTAVFQYVLKSSQPPYVCHALLPRNLIKWAQLQTIIYN